MPIAVAIRSRLGFRQIARVLRGLTFFSLFVPGFLILLFGELPTRDATVGAVFGWGIVLCTCSLPSLMRRPGLAVLGFLVPFYCWYFIRFNQPLSSPMVAMASVAPAREVTEFLSMEWPGILAAAGCGLLISLHHWIPSQLDRRHMAAIGLGLVSMLVDQRVFALYFSSSQEPILSTAIVSEAYPTAFLGGVLQEKFEEQFVVKGATPGTVTVVNGVDIAILVIGESARADHWSLNGYEKRTTPKIAEENIINFPSVRSIGNCTAVTVPAMLTLQGPEDHITIFGPVNNQPSIVEIFRAAGYLTALVTNQETSDFGRTGSRFDIVRSIFHSDASGFYGKAYDVDMLPEISSILALPVDRKFLIVHLSGSHFQYFERYRDEFNVFSTTIDSGYDNSILATDAFLAELIARLKATGARIALAYTSDHGEDFGKSGRRAGLHCFTPSNIDTLVPTFFWLQGEYGDLEANLRRNARHYLSQDGVVPALLDLSGIQYSSPRMAKAFTYPKTRQLEQLTLDRAGHVYRCSIARGCRKDGADESVH